MYDLKLRRGLLLISLIALGACGTAFELKNFPTSETLFQAGLREFRAGRWDYAILAFEKLTLDLPARDSLLPRSYWYLLEAGAAYAKMWRKPALDAQYGLSAISTYRTLLAIYPNSPLREPAEKRAQKLEHWFATKDYDTGMYYLRRKAYDPAILYFRDVIRLYPNTPKTRDAYLRLVQSFRAIRYRDDEKETCAAVRQLFPKDREVGVACAAVVADSAALPSS
jgi:outer membrane protein assembly factor BamD (BamD/ComL family)